MIRKYEAQITCGKFKLEQIKVKAEEPQFQRRTKKQPTSGDGIAREIVFRAQEVNDVDEKLVRCSRRRLTHHGQTAVRENLITGQMADGSCATLPTTFGAAAEDSRDPRQAQVLTRTALSDGYQDSLPEQREIGRSSSIRHRALATGIVSSIPAHVSIRSIWGRVSGADGCDRPQDDLTSSASPADFLKFKVANVANPPTPERQMCRKVNRHHCRESVSSGT